MPATRPAEISDGISLSDKLRTSALSFVAEDGTVDALLSLARPFVDAVINKLSPHKQRFKRLERVGSQHNPRSGSDKLRHHATIRVGAVRVMPPVEREALHITVFCSPSVRHIQQSRSHDPKQCGLPHRPQGASRRRSQSGIPLPSSEEARASIGQPFKHQYSHWPQSQYILVSLARAITSWGEGVSMIYSRGHQRPRIADIRAARVAPGPQIQPVTAGGHLDDQHLQRVNSHPAHRVVRVCHVAQFVGHRVPAGLVGVVPPRDAGHQAACRG